MMKWPSAEAQITATDTTWTYRKNEGTKYQQKLTYRFAVKDQTYSGDRITYGGSPPEWRSEAEARKALPAIGSKIAIRFDPTNPSDNVIQVIHTPDADYDMLLWIAAGVGAAGGLLMVAAGKAWRAEKK